MTCRPLMVSAQRLSGENDAAVAATLYGVMPQHKMLNGVKVKPARAQNGRRIYRRPCVMEGSLSANCFGIAPPMTGSAISRHGIVNRGWKTCLITTKRMLCNDSQ